MITGEGLLLRPPTEADRERWFELYQDPDELAYGVPVGVPLPAGADELSAKIQEAVQAIGKNEPATFTIASEEAPQLFLGNIAWRRDVPPFFRTADIGYGVHPDARRRGVASRAVRVFTQWLSSAPEGPLQLRLQLDHSVENEASCRTALAAGFQREGVRRQFLPLRDADAPDGVRRHDVCLHGYLPA